MIYEVFLAIMSIKAVQKWLNDIFGRYPQASTVRLYEAWGHDLIKQDLTIMYKAITPGLDKN